MIHFSNAQKLQRIFNANAIQKQTHKFLFLITTLFLLTMIFACKEANDETEILIEGVSRLNKNSPLIGKWADAYPGYNYDDCDYIIQTNQIGTSFRSVLNGKHKTQVYITKISENAGYLYYQLEDDIIGFGSAPNYESYTVTAKNKWCATAFQNLTNNSVNLADAYRADSPYDFPDTLEECVKKYTIENGYFEYISTAAYTKQN